MCKIAKEFTFEHRFNCFEVKTFCESSLNFRISVNCFEALVGGFRKCVSAVPKKNCNEYKFRLLTKKSQSAPPTSQRHQLFVTCSDQAEFEKLWIVHGGSWDKPQSYCKSHTV